MKMKKIGDGLIDFVSLHSSRPYYARFDVLPFAVLYVSLLVCSMHEDTKMIGLIGTPVVLGVHIILFLLSRWSISLRCFLGYREASNIEHCEVVKVIATKNSGDDKIVKIHHTNKEGTFSVAGNKLQLNRVFFEYQKIKYSFDKDKNTFVKNDYITSGVISDFLKYSGHSCQESVILSKEKYGDNEFDIPVPSFLDLYVEHLVAPFFVFQMLCLLLWSLDDYWYYSVVTLMMLMVFEGMLCKQRQGSLFMLRSMRRSPVELSVFRENRWLEISSIDIVPGDIVSICSADPFKSNRSLGLKSRRNQDYELVENKESETVIPCDLLLVQGTCVVNEAMLTGESVPQMKETCSNADDIHRVLQLVHESNSSDDVLSRRHLLFGGTEMLQHTQDLQLEMNAGSGKAIPIPRPPNKGCVGIALRTGYGTAQGGLMRKILFAAEKIGGANSLETFYFIGILVVFAFLASSFVLYYGLQDESRNKFKLVLHCIMIVTSVIPPELPMELSLAVTNSLAALSRGLVFCTEPFRIPFAGRLSVLCFDKTGTLTKDKLILRGVVTPITNRISEKPAHASPILSPDEVILPAKQCASTVQAIMGSCHSLFNRNGKLIGDPLEIATMEATDCTIEGNDNDNIGLQSGLDSHINIRVKHRYAFSSSLKRMSVLVDISESDSGSIGVSKSYLFTKGAPEVLEKLFGSLPTNYSETYSFHMRQGKRVLAMGYRVLEGKETASIREQSRNDIEKNLIFSGFLVFDSPLKLDSKSVMKELRSSLHKVVMITGDSVFTAIDVAKRLAMIPSDSTGCFSHALILRVISTRVSEKAVGNEIKSLVWRKSENIESAEPLEGDRPFDLSSSEIVKLCKENFVLCVTGSALTYLKDLMQMNQGRSKHSWSGILNSLCPNVTVFARVSPIQKEEIILAMNEAGLTTLMVGDGTNDVGALKAAHVGVSIVNDPEFEKRIEATKKEKKEKSKKSGRDSAQDRMNRAIAEFREQEQDPTIIKLGDASIASSFTSRRTSIDAVLTVIRQGRCTLVTTVQVYKILALNCLVSAYMMSTLYLKGLKQGDMQMTAVGLVTAGLFFFLSQAKPQQCLSEKRPSQSVFCKAVSCSIVGQFIVHLACIIMVLALCAKFTVENVDAAVAIPDGRFQPNLINTAVFLLSAVIQCNNFVVNYRGTNLYFL